MKLYRNHRYTEDAGSGGYHWFASKGEAERAAKKEPDRYSGDLAIVAEEIVFSPIKSDILFLLQHYASHADNG